MNTRFAAALLVAITSSCVVQTEQLEGLPGEPGAEGSKGDPGPPGTSPWSEGQGAIYYVGGDVGIGTSTPGAALHAERDGLVRARMENTAAAAAWDIVNEANGDFTVSLQGTGTRELSLTRTGHLGIGCAGADHLLVLGSGSSCASAPGSFVDAGDTTFTVTSSRAFKKNLRPVKVHNILDKIQSIPVYTYDFVNGPRDRIGLVAEDFHTIFERGSDKEISGHEMQLAMWLAIHELTDREQKLAAKDKEIDDLKARVERLEGLVQRMARP